MTIEVGLCIITCDYCLDWLRLPGSRAEVTEQAEMRGWTRNRMAGAARRDFCPKCSAIRREST